MLIHSALTAEEFKQQQSINDETQKQQLQYYEESKEAQPNLQQFANEMGKQDEDVAEHNDQKIEGSQHDKKETSDMSSRDTKTSKHQIRPIDNVA